MGDTTPPREVYCASRSVVVLTRQNRRYTRLPSSAFAHSLSLSLSALPFLRCLPAISPYVYAVLLHVQRLFARLGALFARDCQFTYWMG